MTFPDGDLNPGFLNKFEFGGRSDQSSSRFLKLLNFKQKMIKYKHHGTGLLNEKVAECDPHDFSEKLPSNAFSSPT